MAKARLQGTLVDHLVAAIVPVLIMVMVGSLTFFMLDLWYQGPFLERLRWILFWFVFGIVLITRVGMQIGDVAKGYGVALGGAVALVATSFAGSQPFLLAVMGLVWWATHHLTYDCTLMEENEDAGVGLLQETGLGGEDAAAKSAMANQEPDELDSDPHRMEASLLGPSRPWWKFWGNDGTRRPHAPGAWLIYFALASLPIFGLGQWLVPAVDDDRRSGLLIYTIAYIAGAMGLLLSTSFLNLRRYLRKRKIPMPKAMTATWLTTGGMVIVVLTFLSAALLPAIAGVRSITGSAVSSGDRRASRWAVLRDSGVQGDGAQSEGKAASKSDEPQDQSGEEQGSGRTNDPNASKRTGGKGREGGKNQAGGAKSGSPRGKSSSSSKGNASGKQGKQSESARDAGKSQGKSDSREDDPQQKGESKGEDQDSEEDQRSKDEQGQSQGSNSPSNTPSLSLQTPGWLRIPILIVGGCFLLYGAFRYGPELLKGLMAFLAALFGGLWFGGPRQHRGREEGEAANQPIEPPRPFSSFPNPFDAGMDRQFAPNDLFVYSFQALEAWAFEAGLGRLPHETPVEFTRKLGVVKADLNSEANRLATSYVRIVYGGRVVKPEALQNLRVFWRTLEAQDLATAGR